jgi:hypothetical protein
MSFPTVDDHSPDIPPAGHLVGQVEQFLLQLPIQPVHRRTIQPDDAYAFRDIQTNEFGHRTRLPTHRSPRR